MALVWKYVGPDLPAEEVVKYRPFQTQAEAHAKAKTWGKDKAETYNVFK